MSAETLVSIDNLSISFPNGSRAVDNLSLEVKRGEMLAIVGESGSGKSLTAMSIPGLLPKSALAQGSVRWKDTELLGADESALRRLRGSKIGVIFQEPLTALNPLHTIERQIGEVIELHLGLSREARTKRCIELMELVGIPSPYERLGSYPHELSGGQRQRVMIAMALAGEPELLIADEPTTALDVTLQRQILQLLGDLQRRLNLSVILISHDLGIVRRYANRVAIMCQGRIVEEGTVEKIFSSAQHAYTQELLAAEPDGKPVTLADNTAVVCKTENLKVWFPVKKGVFRRTVDHIRAVNDCSISLRAGETLGIVGESGSGKTTLGLAIMRLIPSSGHIMITGTPVSPLRQTALRPLRKQFQMVFQDPYGSLSPRMTVADIIGEGLDLHGIPGNLSRDELIIQAMKDVMLDPASRHRYPHEFSGGQRQRISIARALVLRPRLIVMDEPTSALDRTVQKQIVLLLRELQLRYGFAMIFISHDLKVVKALSHQLLVMKHGDIVEAGPAGQVFASPSCDYTKELLNAAGL